MSKAKTWEPNELERLSLGMIPLFTSNELALFLANAIPAMCDGRITPRGAREINKATGIRQKEIKETGRLGVPSDRLAARRDFLSRHGDSRTYFVDESKMTR